MLTLSPIPHVTNSHQSPVFCYLFIHPPTYSSLNIATPPTCTQLWQLCVCRHHVSVEQQHNFLDELEDVMLTSSTWLMLHPTVSPLLTSPPHTHAHSTGGFVHAGTMFRWMDEVEDVMLRRDLLEDVAGIIFDSGPSRVTEDIAARQVDVVVAFLIQLSGCA